MCQSSYIAFSCKSSLLSRQRTTKALIRLHRCAGWSAPLLLTYDKNRFSHNVAHFQINRSYLCRIRKKRVCCIQFCGKKKKRKERKKKKNTHTHKKHTQKKKTNKQQQQQKKKQKKKTKTKKKTNKNKKKQQQQQKTKLLIYHSGGHFLPRIYWK